MVESRTTFGRSRRRLRSLGGWSAIAVLGLSLSPIARAAADEVPHAPDELIVGFDPAASTTAEQRAVTRQGATIQDRASLIDAAVVEVAAGQSLDVAETALERSAAIDYAEPNYEVESTADANDPFYSSQWGLPTVSWPAAMDMLGAGEHTPVAVTDTGLDRNHPDISSHLWTNQNENPSNGIDDDSNGLVDDYYGADYYNYDGNPLDDNGHGTHVSGIITAATNNYQGVAGMVPNGHIMAVKFLGASGSGSTWGAIQAIQYSVAKGAKVINASWGGGGYSTSLRNAIRSAGQSGALFVAAAGNSARNNDSYPFYPASYNEPNIVAVAATTQSESLAYFSNYGKNSVDLGAPGYSILSTYLGGGYAYLSGTSMAAPFVSGAAGALRALNPTITYPAMRDAILGSTDPQAALQNTTVTGGRLNVAAAVQAAGGQPPGQPPPPPEDPGDDSPPEPGEDEPPDPEIDFPEPFQLVTPRNRAVIRSKGRSRSSRRLLSRDGRVILDWTDSGAITGIASYTVVVDRRVEDVVRDPDGRDEPEAPESRTALDLKPGRHSWYVVAKSWVGNSRVNTYLHGSAKRYFTYRSR